MAAEFRQRSAGELLNIFKRRKWHIILPLLAVGIAVSYVVTKLPNMYESRTSLTLKPPSISPDVVKSLTEDDLSSRLQQMNQEILSRNTLEQMIGKFRLYEPERAAGMDMALVVDKMRKNIKIEVEKGDSDKVTGFSLKYSDRTPEAARNVAADLANKYVNLQIIGTIKNAEDTKAFIESQLSGAKANLDAISNQRIQIMTQNVQTLPESGGGLIAQLEGLRQREQTISKEKETLIVEKGRLNDSIRMLNSQINLAQNFGTRDAEDAVKQTRIEDTPAYGQLIQQRAALAAKYENQRKMYTDKLPEVAETKAQLEKIDQEIDKLKQSAQDKAKTVAEQGNRKTQLQMENIKLEKDKAESQIAGIEQQMVMKDNELSQNSAQISILEGKINSIPQVKVALEAIDNQYQTAKTTYDELLKKTTDAGMQVSRETNSQGETIRVVDAASLPSSPVNASKRFVLMGAGFGIGLFIGLFLAGIFEVPRLFKIQNIEDAKHYTGLPVLASVPPLLTRDEIAWQNRSYWLKVMAGIVVAFGSIPLLIIVLQASHIFEQIAS